MSNDLSRLFWRAGEHYEVLDSGCWRWLGWINRNGYGMCPSTLGQRLAHRASYAASHGSVPKGAHVHHRCHTKACVNPDHLEVLAADDHLRLHRMAEGPITWEIVREIRVAALAGERMDDLKARYGISWGTLHPIIHNLTWQDPDYTPGFERACEECGSVFTTTHSAKRFCRVLCRTRWNSRRTWRRKQERRAA